MRVRKPSVVAALLAVALGIPLGLAGQEEGDALGVGEAAWFEHCTVCHGRHGTGDGPFVPLLRTVPPDITLLSRLNGGEFPTQRVHRAVDGRSLPGAHGTEEMPIWGGLWTQLGASEAAVRARVIDIVAYVRMIQK